MKQKAGDADRELGAKMRTFRLAAGKTQEEVGERLGVTFQQIQKYENGTNRVPGTRLVHIAEFLNVSVDELLGTAPPIDEETRRVALEITRMGEGRRAEVLRGVRNVVEAIKAAVPDRAAA